MKRRLTTMTFFIHILFCGIESSLGFTGITWWWHLFETHTHRERENSSASSNFPIQVFLFFSETLYSLYNRKEMLVPRYNIACHATTRTSCSPMNDKENVTWSELQQHHFLIPSFLSHDPVIIHAKSSTSWKARVGGDSRSFSININCRWLPSLITLIPCQRLSLFLTNSIHHALKSCNFYSNGAVLPTRVLQTIS